MIILKRQNKGITLIALVITIILLLILAGISIAQLKKVGLFDKAKLASEISNRNEGEELLKIKIYEYQMNATDKNEKMTLEGLKEYLKNDKEIEYMNLYVEKDDLQTAEEGKVANYAKVKSKKYKYEYVLNKQLDIITKDIQGEELENNKIDLDLQELLKEANMKITLNDILNTPAIMDNAKGLIPILTQDDVTRSEKEGIITYTTKEGEIIKTNSEYIEGGHYAWKAFDGIETGAEFALSLDKIEGYYLEYEFKQNIYAMKAEFIFANGASAVGTRSVNIQAYNEENGEWIDLTEDITITGNGTTTGSTFPLVKENLDYSKPYKRYRLFVKSATGVGFSGAYKMQLYGVMTSEVDDEPSEANLKQALLSNLTLDKITLEQMISNKEFTKRLINSLSIDTVKNNEILMANMSELIDILTESDITRSEVEGVVTYTTNKGEIITTNSEYSASELSAWRAFNGKETGGDYALSKIDEPVGYYLGYEFKQKVYAMSVEFKFANGASASGTRGINIQAYNEESKEWIDLTEDITITGNGTATGSTFPLVKEKLDYSKPYKKYRLFVKNATGAGGSGLYKMQLYGKVE